MNFKKLLCVLSLAAMCFNIQADESGFEPDLLDTGFSYQGELMYMGEPANGEFDFRFFLYDAEVDGNTVGNQSFAEDLMVRDGVFTSILDFGETAFTSGLQLWLDVGVREGDVIGPYTPMTPRTKITAAPYVQALIAAPNRLSDQNYSISALTLNDPNIIRHVGFSEAYLKPGTSVAWATAPVHLPEGAVIKRLTCLIKDNDPTGKLTFKLQRHQTPDTPETSIIQMGTTDASANPAGSSLLQVSGNNIEINTVSNLLYSYYLQVVFDGLQGPDLAVYRCQIRWAPLA